MMKLTKEDCENLNFAAEGYEMAQEWLAKPENRSFAVILVNAPKVVREAFLTTVEKEVRET